MDRDASEEDEEAEEPLEILEEGADEAAFANSIAHHCQRDVTETVEDDDKGDPGIPRVDVVFVNV